MLKTKVQISCTNATFDCHCIDSIISLVPKNLLKFKLSNKLALITVHTCLPLTMFDSLKRFFSRHPCELHNCDSYRRSDKVRI